MHTAANSRAQIRTCGNTHDPGSSANAHELANRQKKALKLVEVIRFVGFCVDTAEQMTEEQWDIAARAARVHRPSEKTRALVIEILRAGGKHD